jgi:hypothetical protein
MNHYSWCINKGRAQLFTVLATALTKFQRQSNNVKMAVSWVVALCNLVEVYRHFTGACILRTDVFMLASITSLKFQNSTCLACSYQQTDPYTPCGYTSQLKPKGHHTVTNQCLGLMRVCSLHFPTQLQYSYKFFILYLHATYPSNLNLLNHPNSIIQDWKV